MRPSYSSEMLPAARCNSPSKHSKVALVVNVECQVALETLGEALAMVVVTVWAVSLVEALMTTRAQALAPVFKEPPGEAAVKGILDALEASAATVAWAHWDQVQVED